MAIPAKVGLAAFDFADGTLLFTEAGSRKQASLHLVAGEAPRCARSIPAASKSFDDRRSSSSPRRSRSGNHTLKRIADRSAPLQRHRQRLLRRDPARGAALAGQADARADRRGDRAAVRGDARRARYWTRRAAGRDRRRLSREGHRLPPRHGGARPLRQALPASAARRSSASSTRATKRTTARPARRAASCSPIARCRACCATTGRKRSRSSSGRAAAEALYPV